VSNGFRALAYLRTVRRSWKVPVRRRRWTHDRWNCSDCYACCWRVSGEIMAADAKETAAIGCEPRPGRCC